MSPGSLIFRRFLILQIIIFISVPVLSQELELQRFNGEKIVLSEVNSGKASVFVFYSKDCPLCKNYTLTMNRYSEKYGKKVNIYAVFAGKQKKKKIHAYVRKYNFSPEILLDTDFKLVEHFDARVTPEAFLLDKTGKVVYRGAIDNWVIKLGTTRTEVTEHYLGNAIDQLLAGEEVVVGSKKAIGCFIK